MIAAAASAAVEAASQAGSFPVPLDSYTGEQGLTLPQVLLHRIDVDPFNAVATAIFLLAILHTFVAPKFLALSHRLRDAHEARNGGAEGGRPIGLGFLAGVLHFFGEVEAVFGIWIIPLIAVLVATKGWKTAEKFLHSDVKFTEAIFVVVIMTISSTRPILDLAERALGAVARLGGRSPLAWWLSILTVGPLAGSFITEPAAMSICAILIGRHIFELGPRPVFRYATLGLLFVNVSVGGTLTSFAAPPVLMVAGRWGWDGVFMFTRFGGKAAIGIVIANALYALAFRRELGNLAKTAATRSAAPAEETLLPVPVWVTVSHLFFLGFTVFTAHTPAMFIGAFLFFLAFTEATSEVQSPVNLRPPLLVGFFLAGLVVHGTLQAWWIAPILGRLSAFPLMVGATILTAFNDNAAITYLASLVPGFSDTAKYAVMAGAVTGGGLTVIANAPNPAGQAILGKYFEEGISPLGLFLGALLPTLVMALCFLLIG